MGAYKAVLASLLASAPVSVLAQAEQPAAGGEDQEAPEGHQGGLQSQAPESRSALERLGIDPASLPPGVQIMTRGPDGKLAPLPLDEKGVPQLPAAATAGSAQNGDIVVNGRKPRGSVLGDIPPELTLSPADIRAYGADSVSDLIDALQPRTGSARDGGPPIVLVNGKRVSNFAEIATLPPEAIERMEIFPEEVALKYGYRPDQKVTNIVTVPRYRSGIGTAGYGFATAGGRSNGELTGGYFSIQDERRLSLDMRYQRAGSLLESERAITASEAAPFDARGNLFPASDMLGAELDPALSALAGVPVGVAAVPESFAGPSPALSDFAPGANRLNRTDAGAYRTLVPATERIALNGTISGPIFGDISASLNGQFEANESDSLLGLPSARLLLPATSPFSPFSDDVLLYRYLSARPIERSADTNLFRLGLPLGAFRTIGCGPSAQASAAPKPNRERAANSMPRRSSSGSTRTIRHSTRLAPSPAGCLTARPCRPMRRPMPTCCSAAPSPRFPPVR